MNYLHIAPWRRLSGALVLVLTSLVISTAGAADGGVQLDADRRAHLLSLTPLLDVDLKQAELDDHVVIVSFFASWCPPCRDEFKNLNALLSRFSSHPVTVVGVNVFEAFDDNDGPRLAKFLKESKPNFAVVEGTDATLTQFGGVNRIPTVYAFGPDESEIMRFIHHRGAKKMHATVEEMALAVRAALQITK